MNLSLLSLDERLWKEVRPLVAKALEHDGGKWTPLDIMKAVMKGEFQLWGAIDGGIKGIGVTRVAQFPQKKVCEMFLVSGKEMDQWDKYLNDIEQWAKSNGCSEISFSGRLGWLRKGRKYGFHFDCVQMNKEI